MSLTKPIPKDMREEMANDPFMEVCCIEDEDCGGRIEWHHNLIYAGKRVNEKWAILPVCHHHHFYEFEFKKRLNKVMVTRATEAELRAYSKAIDYVALKRKYEDSN